MSSLYKTVGIYGGTFSPPHLGHIHAAGAFLAECPLDRLYIIPAYIPPHKQIDPSDQPQNRLRMTELAFAGNPEWGKRLFVSDWEISETGKSYTLYTLKHFRESCERLIFLMGTDMLLTFTQWYKPREICELADIAYISREYPTPELDREVDRNISMLESEYGARIIRLCAPAKPYDSTSLRKALASGTRPDGLSDAVYDYIKQHELYGTVNE